MIRMRKWIRKRENIIIEILVIISSIIIGCISIYLFLSGLLELTEIINVIIGLLIAFLPIYLYLMKKRDQTMLISFTSRYLMERENAKFDELLGVLISGKWERLKLNPIEEFFEGIKKISLSGDYETKRRVTEALPALFKIDYEESKELVEILRVSWDERYRSDIRRRVIESLSNIIKIDKKFVKENIQIHRNDEIFTILASVEILDVWRYKINKKNGEKYFQELKSEMKSLSYTKEEINAVQTLWKLLKIIRTDKHKAIEFIEKLKESNNIYVRIAVARNYRRLCNGYHKCKSKGICKGDPSFVLDLSEYFLEENKHKHIRRPIAKEDSLDCLITIFKRNEHSERIKKIIMTLLNDPDEIIGITCFDKIESILDIDESFGKEIMEYIINNNLNPKLVNRANTILGRYQT